MKTKEISDLAPAEIETKLRAIRDELLQLRLKKPTGQVEKPHTLRVLRKEIARCETVLRKKKAVA